MKKTHYIAAVAAALLISSTAWAGALTIPNTFTAGSPAVAADVNANFSSAKTAVNDNNSRINTVTASASTNTTDIATNTTAITNLQNAALVRTINVSPVIGGGGVVDAVASGTALINAVAGITGSSVTNQFTVKLEPGTYDLVAQTLTLPDGVNLEGSGQEVTTISSSVTPVTNFPFSATVVALGSSVIRHISLKELSTLNFGILEGTAALDIRTGAVLVENSTLFASVPLINNSTVTVKATFLNSRLTQPAGTTSPGAVYKVILIANGQASIDVISSEYGSVANQGTFTATARCFSSYRSNFVATTAVCD